MRPERDRVKALLTEAVSLLCKNSLSYEAEVEVEGLLGITVDKSEVFLVSLHELIKRPETQLQQMAPQQQLQFASSYSATPGKRKRRRKSGDGTPQVASKKMAISSTPVGDTSEAIVLEDDEEESNGSINFPEGAHSTPDPSQNTSHGTGEPTSDTTYDDAADNTNPPVLSNQSALDSSNLGDGDNSRLGGGGQTSQEHFDDGSMPGTSDGIVKEEQFDSFPPEQDDSLGGGAFDSFEPEQKYSALLQQQADPGHGFAMSQGTSSQQPPVTQVGTIA